MADLAEPTVGASIAAANFCSYVCTTVAEGMDTGLVATLVAEANGG